MAGSSFYHCCHASLAFAHFLTDFSACKQMFVLGGWTEAAVFTCDGSYWVFVIFPCIRWPTNTPELSDPRLYKPSLYFIL